MDKMSQLQQKHTRALERASHFRALRDRSTGAARKKYVKQARRWTKRAHKYAEKITGERRRIRKEKKAPLVEAEPIEIVPAEPEVVPPKEAEVPPPVVEPPPEVVEVPREEEIEPAQLLREQKEAEEAEAAALAAKEVPEVPPEEVKIPIVKERETPRQRRERLAAEEKETKAIVAEELGRVERVREQRIAEAREARREVERRAVAERAAADVREAARITALTEAREATERKRLEDLARAERQREQRIARQREDRLAKQKALGVVKQATQRIKDEMTHPSPEVVKANVESRKDLSTENVGKFESTIVTFGQVLDTAKSDKASMITEYNQRKLEYQTVMKDQNKYTPDSVKAYKESYKQYEDIYNSNLKAYDRYISDLNAGIVTSRKNVDIEQTNIGNMNRWLADRQPSTRDRIVRGAVRSDVSIAERELDAKLMEEMAAEVTELRKQVDVSSTHVYPRPVEEVDPNLVIHMGVTMTREQFEADFPPGTIPDSVVAGRPVTKPVDIGKAYEGAFQSVTDPMRGFAKNLSTKAVALAPTQPLVGLATYFAGTTARFAVGVVEGASFFVRPAAWGRTAEAIGLLLRPEKPETYEEYRAKISNFVADDIVDPTLRAQVETQLLASIPYQALSQEDIDQGIAFRQAAGTAIAADPVGFAAEVVGGIVGGYLLGKGVEAGLKKAGVIKPKIAPKQIIETQDELTAWVESIKVTKEPGVSVAPSQWQPYGGEKVPSAFEQAKVFSDMGFTAQDVAGLVPDEVVKAIDGLAKATPYQQAVALNKMGFGVKDVAGIAPDEVVRAFKDYVASSPYKQAKALFDKGFGVKDVAGTVPDEVVKIIDDLAKASPYQQAKALHDLGFDIAKAPSKLPSDVVKAFDDMKVAPPYQQAKALYDLGFGPKDVKGVVADDVLTALTDMKVAPAYQQAVAIDYFQKLIKSGMPYEEAARTMDVMMKGGTAVVQLQSGAVITYRPTLLYTGTGLPEVGSLVGAVVVATGIEPGIERPPAVVPEPPTKLTRDVVVDALQKLDIDTAAIIAPKLVKILDLDTVVNVVKDLDMGTKLKVIPNLDTDVIKKVLPGLDDDTLLVIILNLDTDVLTDVLPGLSTDVVTKVIPDLDTDTIVKVIPNLDTDTIQIVIPTLDTLTILDVIPVLDLDTITAVIPALTSAQLQAVIPRLRERLPRQALQQIRAFLPMRLRKAFRIERPPIKIPPSKKPESYKISFQYDTGASETKRVEAKTFHEALVTAEGQKQIPLDPVEVEVEKLALGAVGFVEIAPTEAPLVGAGLMGAPMGAPPPGEPKEKKVKKLKKKVKRERRPPPPPREKKKPAPVTPSGGKKRHKKEKGGPRRKKKPKKRSRLVK